MKVKQPDIIDNTVHMPTLAKESIKNIIYKVKHGIANINASSLRKINKLYLLFYFFYII